MNNQSATISAPVANTPYAPSVNSGNIDKMMSGFIARKPPCQFPNLFNGNNPNAHRFFIQRVIERVSTPHLIEQGKSALCGPNVYVFCLATRHPHLYVKFLFDLWEFGEAKIERLHVKPSQACRYVRLNDEIDPLDWMALASLRDSSNAALNYDSPSDQTAGITMPGDIVEWFSKSNFTSLHYDTGKVYPKGAENLRKAQQHFKGNRSVCFLLNTKANHGNSAGSGKKGFLGIPNHWVVLTQDIKVGGRALHTIPVDELEGLLDSLIEVNVATWGLREGTYPWHSRGKAGQMTLQNFLNCYYGYVAAS